jgi:prepilin-type N-terminal cleavage/methylation domain-containing protein
MWDRMVEKRNEGGFTLIELLIVIIILAILAAIVVFAVGTTGTNAVTASCNADAKTFETALESYKAEVGAYPGASTLNSNAVNEPNNGQTWGGQTVNTVLIGGLQGASGAPGTTWTAPNGQTVGAFLRELPNQTGKQHYIIWTDGAGGVFALNPTPNPPVTSGAGNELIAANNYDLTPSICGSFQ